MTAQWDRLCLEFAYQQAAKSDDPSTQNGAWLLPEHAIPSCGVGGFNHVPAHLLSPGENITTMSKERKYATVQHAERDAIFRAGRLGVRTSGATLYALWYACPQCADAIVAAGINRVVGHRPLLDLTPDRWSAEVTEGIFRLRNAGVECDFLAGPIPGLIRFNGSLFDASEVFPKEDCRGEEAKAG